jgi:membrane fusion protein (multidrug efflux system)
MGLKCLLFALVLSFAHTAYSESLEELINGPLSTSAISEKEKSNAASFRGQFRSVNYAVVSAGIAAKVSSFTVKTGSRVEKGQIIASFDCTIAEVEHKIQRSRERAVGESLKVNKRLNILKNISELDLSLSVAELAIAEAEVERTTKILEECVIHAPFSGTITQKMAQAYEYVNVGDPLVELIDTENIEIEMVLPSLHLSSYTRGTPFSMRVDETGQMIDARVERVVNVVDPVSQTVRIIGSLTRPVVGLMPGMSGRVVFSGTR